MEKADRKRHREGDREETSSLPAYGSQQYWEDRYKRLQTKSVKEESKNAAEDEPDPFHSWYFNYEELAPLILPLIVGDMSLDDPHEADQSSRGDKVNEESSTSLDAKSSEETNNNTPNNDTGIGKVDDSGSVDEDCSEDDLSEGGSEEILEDEEDGPPTRVGLAKDGPIEILEVGCGDVPIGRDIIFGIKELEKSEQRIHADKILKSVTCIDYSDSVIEAMKAKQVSHRDMEPSIPLEFTRADARKLPYSNERFHFVFEKGTMDAMLSDSKMGNENCRSIVAEMARVLAMGGVIMIISHINAHTEDGIDWLNNIVVPGLRNGECQHEWSVEIHCGDMPENLEGEDDESASLGPAVYIIHKGKLVNATDSADPPTISLRFYSY